MNMMTAEQMLDDMRQASQAVDDANGPSDYLSRLVTLAHIARVYLRLLEREKVSVA